MIIKKIGDEVGLLRHGNKKIFMAKKGCMLIDLCVKNQESLKAGIGLAGVISTSSLKD